MESRMLGKTNIKVSRLCFGSLTLSPMQKNLTLKQAYELLEYAFCNGVNFIDTADLYNNYSQLSAAIKNAKNDIVVASKTYAYTKEDALKAVDKARHCLNRDYIDIFLLHEQESVHTLNGHSEALCELYRLKALGVIKAVGLSTHHVAGVYGGIEKGVDVIHPIINKNGLGICDGSLFDMEEAIKKAHSLSIGIYSMKAFGGGNLFLKADECLSYVTSLPFIDSIAIGMQTKDEVNANINFFKNGCFSFNQIKSLAKKTRVLYIEDYCEGCFKCVKACKQNALQIKNNKVVCNNDKCVFCAYCAAACPCYAIKVI